MSHIIKKALSLHNNIGNDLADMGGIIQCKSEGCQHEQPATSEYISHALAHGWKCPMCGSPARWVTQKELDEQSDS